MIWLASYQRYGVINEPLIRARMDARATRLGCRRRDNAMADGGFSPSRAASRSSPFMLRRDAGSEGHELTSKPTSMATGVLEPFRHITCRCFWPIIVVATATG